jgi:hypothetical protein
MAQAAELCEYCSKLIPPKPSPSRLGHYANIGLLRQSSLQCPMCNVVQNRCSLERVTSVRIPGFDEEDYDDMRLEMRFLDTRSFGSGLDWGELEVTLEIPSHVVFHFLFSITTCESGCEFTPSIFSAPSLIASARNECFISPNLEDYGHIERRQNLYTEVMAA